MAIKDAESTLTQGFFVSAITGFVYQEQGYIDSDGFVKAQRTATWNSLADTTWDSYRQYANQLQKIRWTAPLIDLGQVSDFNLNITADADADVFYIIHTSETGVFGGEETQVIAENGSYNVPSFRGQFVYVTAVTDSPVLRRLQISTSNNQQTVRLTGVDTSTLSGSAGNRSLAAQNYSGIIAMQVTPRAADPAYDLNLYVSDFTTSTVLIPVVKSLSTAAPTFGLFGIDNEARDGVVDIELTVLPRQVMFDSDLTVI